MTLKSRTRERRAYECVSPRDEWKAAFLPFNVNIPCVCLAFFLINFFYPYPPCPFSYSLSLLSPLLPLPTPPPIPRALAPRTHLALYLCHVPSPRIPRPPNSFPFSWTPFLLPLFYPVTRSTPLCPPVLQWLY